MRQVQLIDECIDDSNRIVLTDVVVQALREEHTLRPVLPFDESLHHCYVFPKTDLPAAIITPRFHTVSAESRHLARKVFASVNSSSMCGRYNLIPDGAAWGAVDEIFGAEIAQQLREIATRYNVAPTQMVPIIVMDDSGKPALIEARWGFIPEYWNQPTPPTKTTNVRSETAAKKPMWRHAWRHKRCLVPASGWYEWFVLEDGSKKPPKVPHHLRRQDGEHIMFAGLWSMYHASPDSPGLPTCSIVTIPSPPSVAEIHARTPVVLDPDFWLPWIDRDSKDPAVVSDIVKNGAVKLFSKHTLGNAVSNSRNQGPELITPIDRPEVEQQKGLLVDDEVLAWLRTTPAIDLRRIIAGLLDQVPMPPISQRRLWLREIEDREDADALFDLMEEILQTIRLERSPTPKKPPPAPSTPDQGALF